MIFARDIQRAVAAEYSLPIEVMRGRRKRYSESRPRQTAIYLSSCLTTHSYCRLGQLFDKDHSTIIHAVEVVTKRLSTDKELQAAMRRIARRVLAA